MTTIANILGRIVIGFLLLIVWVWAVLILSGVVRFKD